MHYAFYPGLLSCDSFALSGVNHLPHQVWLICPHQLQLICPISCNHSLVALNLKQLYTYPLNLNLWFKPPFLCISAGIRHVCWWPLYGPLLINDMQTPPPHLSKRAVFFRPKSCTMNWNEWKINFLILVIFIFCVMVKKFTKFENKNDHISKTKNRKIHFSFVSAYSSSFI